MVIEQNLDSCKTVLAVITDCSYMTYNLLTARRQMRAIHVMLCKVRSKHSEIQRKYFVADQGYRAAESARSGTQR